MGYDGGGFKEMKLTYGGQTIDLFSEEYFPDGPPKQIFLGLSGGLDSSALLYLICENFPEIEVFPYAGNDLNHPMDYLNAINVNQWFMERYNQVHKTWIFKFDAIEEPYWSRAAEMFEKGETRGFSSVRGLAKTFVMNERLNEYWNKNHRDLVRMSGMTSNPPTDEMKKYDFYDVAERRRDKEVPKTPFTGRTYEPLLVVDKKFVAGVYQEHGLMDELFPMTGSCVGSVASQGYGSHGCGQCFWCKEKEWSFGVY